MGSGSSPVRVFLVAEHTALCQSLALLLEGEGMVVRTATGMTARAPREIPPGTDVVIVALPTAGPEDLRRLREICSHPAAPPTIVVSPDDDVHSIRAALAAGARAHVPNRRVSEVLVYAVRALVAGGCWRPGSAARPQGASDQEDPVATSRRRPGPARRGSPEPDEAHRHPRTRGGRS
jgi:DNA-binding NarL/FixJ family response regulator